MTNEEALNVARQSLAAFEFVPEAYDVEYTKLCAAAIEKQIAKETADTFVCGDFGRAVSYGHCPTCGAFACGDAYNFCPKCGQKLDWKEEKEKEK